MTQLYTEALDVRTIPPFARHATIFNIIERLEPGATFSIVNDHDPVPLRRQIEARYPGLFSWTYLVEGPGLWHVEIGKVEDADGCGGHGEGHPCTCGS